MTEEIIMSKGDKIKEWSVKAYGDEESFKIAGIMTYEAGDVLRDTIRINDSVNCKNLYTKQLMVSLGDVIAMARLLCSMEGINYEEVDNEGCERAIERCKEKLAGMDGF